MEQAHETGAIVEEASYLFTFELQNSCFWNVRFILEPCSESTEDPWSLPPPTHNPPQLPLSLFALALLWQSHKVRPPAAIYKCPILFLPLSPRPLAPLVTSYHRQSPAALFTLGAVAEMCHRDVMLHTPGDKTRQTLFTHVASVSPPTPGHTCTRTCTGKDTSGKKGAQKRTHKHVAVLIRFP